MENITKIFFPDVAGLAGQKAHHRITGLLHTVSLLIQSVVYLAKKIAAIVARLKSPDFRKANRNSTTNVYLKCQLSNKFTTNELTLSAIIE